MMSNPISVEELGRFDTEKFWSKVNLLGDCWEWKGERRNGYGRMKFGTRYYTAHRISYSVLKQIELNPKDVLDHLCRNRSCVNPAHLELTDHRTNILRGVGITAVQAKVNHCPRGHTYTPENLHHTYLKRGSRWCSVCKKELDELRSQANKAMGMTQAAFQKSFGTSRAVLEAAVEGRLR